MPMLNTSKLYGRVNGRWVLGTPTRTTSKGEEYRCPVCATGGGDENGQHLIVFKDRANYACAAYPGNDKHRRAIWRIAGVMRDKGGEPFIPRKIEQKDTFIGRHVIDLEKLSHVFLKADREARLRRIEEEKKKAEAERLEEERMERRLEEERKRREEEAERELERYRERQNEILRKWREQEDQKAKRLEEYNTNSKCDKTRFGTFGTGISCSANMPPPPIKEATTVSNGRGYAVPICEKASQTSQVRSWRKAVGPEDCNENEEYSSDFGMAFDRNNPKWREHYYLWYRSKYYGEAVAF